MILCFETFYKIFINKKIFIIVTELFNRNIEIGDGDADENWI